MTARSAVLISAAEQNAAAPTAAAVFLPAFFVPPGLSLLSSAAVSVAPRPAACLVAHWLARSGGGRLAADPLAVDELDRLVADPLAVGEPDRLAADPAAACEPGRLVVVPAVCGLYRLAVGPVVVFEPD